MSADFTPSLNTYTDLTPFRFWCQKVLPLVYDDSLSYYELLCKVVDYLNKTMEDVNLSIEDVEKLHDAYDSLQDYVNDYFNNLDVQEEINNKLDALVEDGTIHDIFNSDVEAILNTASQAAHDAIEAIPSNVTAWLDTHVTPETGVLIDESLTIDGAAADAKATGDQIRDLKSDINTLELGHQNFTTDDIIQGSYNADGSVSPNQNRIRIEGFIELQAGDTLRFTPGTNAAAMLYGTYNENKVFQGDSQWYASEHLISTNNHIYLICVFKNSGGTAITPSQYDATVVKTLSETNKINNLNDILAVTVSPTSEDIIDNKYITTNGELSTTTTDFNCTDYLNVYDISSDNVTLTCTVYGYAGFAFYDEDKTVLLSITGDNASSYGIQSIRAMQTFSVQKPANAYYVRMSAYKTSYSAPTDLVVAGYGYGDLNSRLTNVEQEISVWDTGNLFDKKVLVIGDSISADAYANYPKWVTDLINAGFFDGDKVTNSSQHATGFVARYDGQANDFITRLKAIANPSQYDLVVVFGGINDYIQNVPMGSETGTDYTVSFKPAVNEFFDYLIRNFTQARLCVLTPLRTYATWQNSASEYQQAYSEYIKQVAKSYCLPVLDLTEDSGYCPYITEFRNMWTLQPAGFEGHDGVHPTEEYQSTYLAPMIKNFLRGLL